jgi:hypothetical protein
MSSENIIAAVNQAMASQHIDDRVVAAGQFSPRGSSGGMFVGGLAGDSLLGDVAGLSGVATVGGALAGARAAGQLRHLPQWMLVGVSDDFVYGFEGRSRHKAPGRLVFRLPRRDLQVSVAQRVNVRTLTLTSPQTQTTIELEGMRLPITHSKDVIAALRRTGR